MERSRIWGSMVAGACLFACSGGNHDGHEPPGGATEGGGTFDSIPSPAVLVAEGGAERLTVLDPESLLVVGSVSVGEGLHPHHIGLAPDGSRALLVATSADLSAGHSGGGHGAGHGSSATTRVYELEVESRELRSVISVDAVAHNAAFLPDGSRIALGMMEHGMISLYDADTFEEVSSATGFAMPLEVTPTTNNGLLVAESGGGTVAWYDLATESVSERFDVGAVPVAAWASGGQSYFVSVEGDMQLRHIVEVDDAIELDEHEIDPTGMPGQAMLTPDGTELWVAVEDAGSLAVLDAVTHATLATIETGGKPHGIAFEPSGARAFVTDEDESRVLVVDVAGRSVSSEIPVGDKPNGIAWLGR